MMLRCICCGRAGLLWTDHHFKAVAAMSPVQYQKRLRLQEARRLLLSDATPSACANTRDLMRPACSSSRDPVSAARKRIRRRLGDPREITVVRMMERRRLVAHDQCCVFVI